MARDAVPPEAPEPAMAASKATAPTTLGEPASSRSGGSLQITSSTSTRSTAPPPARKGSPSANARRGPIRAPAPKGAYSLWPLKARKSGPPGSGRWGASWAASSATGTPRSWAASQIASTGGSQPVTLEAPVRARSAGCGALVQRGHHVVHPERAVGPALHVAPLGHPPPGEEVGVVLDHRGDHHGAGGERQAVGEVVDAPRWCCGR